MIDISADLGKFKLKNPVMTASGTFGYGREYADFFPLEKLGAIVVKGICEKPCHGNPTPRIAEVTSGMLNAIGLQGPGVDKFLHDDDYMPFLRKVNTAVIVNIWGKTIEEYEKVARMLDAEKEGITALEVNISCPNIKEGGIAFGTDLKLAAKVVSGVRKSTSLPIITKLSPNVSSIPDFAKAVRDAGTDVISLINTIPGMAIDIETGKPKIANIRGGLSGPAIKPIALRMVYEAAGAVDIPVIGMGGIMTAEDAVEFLLAGASAVAVGTAIFTDPFAPLNVIDGIRKYMKRKSYACLKDFVGRINIEKK